VIRRLKANALRLISDRTDVLAVRLFGSLARGDARPGSDADIVIVLRESRLPFMARGAELANAFAGVGVGCDLLVYTEEEWRHLEVTQARFFKVVESEGVTLAAR
jgi:predicted nucleotidyltransferase